MKRTVDFDFIDFVQYTSRIIRQKFLFLIIAVIVGGGIGGLLFTTRPMEYRLKCISEYGYLPYPIFKSQINQLNEYIRTKNRPLLAKELDITLEQARNIQLIEVEDIAPADEINTSIGFAQITLVYKREENLGKLILEKFFNRLNNSKTVSKYLTKEKELINKQLEVIGSQIHSAREIIEASTDKGEVAAVYNELKLSQNDSLSLEIQKSRISSSGVNNSIIIYPITPSLLAYLVIGAFLAGTILFLYFLKNLMVEAYGQA